MSLDRSLLLNRRVVVAIVLQVVGYAALLAVYPHSEPSAIVESLYAVPTVVLVIVALPAIPSLVLTIVVGAFFGLLGLPPESIPAILLARGDVLFFACAYAVAVASARIAAERDELGR